jgi:hypothetical protein
VLTGPLAIAALVLGVAGLAKLRAPHAAARAALVAGLPGARRPVPGFAVARRLVRTFAAVEVAVSLWCLADPGRLAAAALAGMDAGLAGIGFVLARRGATCGCFGADDGPASTAHWLLSGALAAVGAGAAVWTPHGLPWALIRHPAVAVVLAVGVAGAAYALVVAYRQLGSAWSAWSGR